VIKGNNQCSENEYSYKNKYLKVKILRWVLCASPVKCSKRYFITTSRMNGTYFSKARNALDRAGF